MLIAQSRSVFEAQAAAASVTVGATGDLAVKALGQHVLVQPLTMVGLRYLVWDLNLAVPEQDILILQCNLAAAAGGRIVAWTQR